LILLFSISSIIASCALENENTLSASEIQATLNAIVTASAFAPGHNSTPVPFNVSQPIASGWEGEVVSVEPRQTSIDSIQWIDDTLLQFGTSQGTYLLNLNRWGQWDQAWSAISEGSQTIIPSPDGRYHILIENHMWIVRKFDGNPIGLIGDVPDPIVWTSDGSAVVFAITDEESEMERGIYAWSVDSPGPSMVLAEPSNTGRVILSSNGSRAAYLVNSSTTSQMSLRLVDIPSGDAETRTMELAPGWRLERWVSQNLIEFSRGTSMRSYAWYNIGSQVVFEVEYGDVVASQSASLPSPNGQWIAGYDIQVNEGSTGEMTTDLVEHIYFVTDLDTQEDYSLAFGGDSALEYLTWSPDSRSLYLVSSPTHQDALPYPDLPFGLLTYDPENSTSELLFGKAVQASINPEQQWAYIVFPSVDANDQHHLTAALWEIGSETLLQRRVVLDEFVYRNPTAIGGQEPAIYVYVQWAHNGEKLVVVDPQGSVVLYDLNGQAQVLHTNLFLDQSNWIEEMDELQSGGIFWSPNDEYILIDYNGVFLLRLE
jgi:hypothetical protein